MARVDAGAIAIGVPVRNEVARLPRLLDALAAQRGAPPFVLCFFFDNCEDGSAELVGSLGGALPYRVETDRYEARGPANAGFARRRAMTLAMAAAPGGVLLTTDADSAPAADWIAANLAALAKADVVAGRIVRGFGPPSPLQDHLERYRDRLHGVRRALDPVAWEGDPSHPWTSGASLAFSAATYRALGGFPPLVGGEDAALADAAARGGYTVRRDAAVLVRTSARRSGRACNGFASALAALDEGGETPTVTHPDDEAWRFRRQAEARRLHGGGDLASFAARLGLSLAEVEQVAHECRNGEAFAARIVGAPPTGLRAVSLAHAELLLAAWEQEPLEGVA